MLECNGRFPEIEVFGCSFSDKYQACRGRQKTYLPFIRWRIQMKESEYLFYSEMVLTIKIDMIHETIDNFRTLAPLQLPGLCDPDRLDNISDYGDYAMLTYLLAEPLPMETVMDDFEDNMELRILYHVDTIGAGSRSEHCCAYASPSGGKMYKVNVQSDGTGLVSTLYVHIYESLEVMFESLKEDMDTHLKSCLIHYRITMSRLVADFM